MKLTRIKQYELPFSVLGLASTPDGAQAYAACMDGSVHAVETATGKMAVLEQTHSSYASGCVLLPDGKTLISGGYDGMLLWHDVSTRKCTREVKAHTFWSWQLALSPDGQRVASVTGQYLAGGWKYEPAAETEPSVRVYDTASGALVASYGHTPPVLSCVFSPDGRHLAAANMLGEVRVWDVQAQDGKPVSQWTTPDFTSWGTTKSHHYSGGIYSLAFSPDGNALVGCGMGPMVDPMAGNGKMTWQRWDWRTGKRMDQIKDGQHGSGLMETLVFHPAGHGRTPGPGHLERRRLQRGGWQPRDLHGHQVPPNSRALHRRWQEPRHGGDHQPRQGQARPVGGDGTRAGVQRGVAPATSSVSMGVDAGAPPPPGKHSQSQHSQRGGLPASTPPPEDSTLAEYRDCVRGASDLPVGLIVTATLSLCGRLLTPDAMLDFGGSKPLTTFSIDQAHGFSWMTEP